MSTLSDILTQAFHVAEWTVVILLVSLLVALFVGPLMKGASASYPAVEEFE